MSTTETVRAWSTTAATNATADAAIASSDSQSPDTVDNNIRSIMVAVKKQENDTGGNLAAGGTANALTVTTGQVLESGQLAAGLRLLLRATADNTSTTVTFAPDGLTAANIKRADGSALAVGSIKSGMYLDLVYNTGSSEWRCANIAPVTAGAQGSALASFSVRKSADQTISSAAETLVTWNTEDTDVGSFFASNTWTPPAGKVIVVASVYLQLLSAEAYYIIICKNGLGNGVAQGQVTATAGTPSQIAEVTWVGAVTGSDTITVTVQSTADTSYQVSAGVPFTRFQGSMI